MVESGELSFCYMSTVRFSAAAPELQLLELPFVVEDRATVGGLTGVGPFARIGACAYVGGCSKVTADVPPFEGVPPVPPLAVIVGYLDILRATQAEPIAQDAVSIASKHAQKLEGMLENLLDFSRLEEDTLNLQLGPHDLGDLLRSYVEERGPSQLEHHHGLAT